MPELKELEHVASRLRLDSIRMTAEANSGHATSSLSAADLVAVLFANHLRYDFDNPKSVHNDRFILSKGHASPLLYAAFSAAGAVDEATLLSYRKLGSTLEGHPTPVLPWVDVATGSLGQGLPIGVGTAVAAKSLHRVPSRTWVLCGDSELAEGSVWEAVAAAADMHLGNLTAIVDVNRLGQRGETRYGWDTDAYARRFEAFGWSAIQIDGHNTGEIDHALGAARSSEEKPVAVLAKTIKGKGAPEVENQNGFHGQALDNSEELIEIFDNGKARLRVRPPETDTTPHTFQLPARDEFSRPSYEPGQSVATRDAYGDTITYLGSLDRAVVALDAEVSNSTRAETFRDTHPERFFEMYIAEQQMIAAAVGMQVTGWKPFCSTFACFMTRAYDFIRMAAVSRANIRLSGSHAGVSIGEDGPSQMGLEDLAMMRAVHGSTVLSPSDANQAVALVELMSEQHGVSYIRTLRPKTPVIYEPGTQFEIGGSKTWGASVVDDITVVATGVTVPEALQAQRELGQRHISCRVIDAYSIKPIDRVSLMRAAAESRWIITAEDHRAEGGLGDAVLEAISEAPQRPVVKKLAVRNMPGSATSQQQLKEAGIDAASIVEAAAALVVAGTRGVVG